MNTVKLYFPSMDQDNRPLNQVISNTIYKELISKLSSINGGCTVYPVQGYYVNSNNQLINDDISLIVSYTNQLEETVKIINEFSMIILKSLNQESVLIEINSKIEFIR